MHARAFFFVDYASVADKNPLIQGFYLLTGFGHQATVLLLVLSGYLITTSLAHSSRNREWHCGNYLITKSLRYFIVVIPGLLLGLICDAATIKVCGPLVSVPNAFGGFSIESRFTPYYFMGNVLFLQEVLVPPFGSNGPLWTLFPLFWSTILFVLVFWMLKKNKELRIKIFLGAGMCAFVFYTWNRFMLFWPLWFCGSLFAMVPIERYSWGRTRSFTIVACGLCITLLGISRIKMGIPAFVMNVLLSVSMGLVIGRLKGKKETSNESKPFSYSRIARCFASFSFTLYCVHFPFLFLISKTICRSAPWQPSLLYLGIAMVVIVATLFYAYMVSLWTESKTEIVSKMVTGFFMRR